MDYETFFRRKSEDVARELLGRQLVRNTDIGSTSVSIIEVGAYEGGNPTPSRAGMNYAPGTVFLMPFRGSQLLNIATDRRGFPSCVEIRAVAFHDRVVEGSGRITNLLDLEGLDGAVLGNELKIIGKPVDDSEVKKIKGDAENCLGYFLVK